MKGQMPKCDRRSCELITIAGMATAVATDLIADVLTARRDELLAAAVEAFLARIPDAEPALVEDARRHTAQHHDLLCNVLRRGRAVQPQELDFLERHAAMRARQGISLTDLLEAFRTYRTAVWDAILEASAGSAAAAEQALAATGTVLAYVDLATKRAAVAYLEAQQRLVADSERVRRDLLEDLLEAGEPQTAAGAEAARAAGFEGYARFLLVAAVTTGALDDDGALSRAATALAAAIRGAGEPLVVTRRREIVLVRPCAHDERPELRSRLAGACERLASEGLVLAVGVSTIHCGLEAVAAAYGEASRAARRAAGEGGVLSLPELSAFDYLTVGQDETARRVIPARIARFVSEDRAHGGHLVRTLLAYAEADMNAKAAAERLLIHVNTAHHRLGRIAEKTGCDLRRLADVIDLLIAVRLVDR
jgi:sugar diacid utilization regulator